jgi:hypothetical protein
MPTPEQKKKLLKAKIAVALQDELGRVPKKEEIEQVFLLARVMYKAILGLHFKPLLSALPSPNLSAPSRHSGGANHESQVAYLGSFFWKSVLPLVEASGATLTERRQLLPTMLDRAYVDSKEERRVVALKLKPAFKACSR